MIKNIHFFKLFFFNNFIKKIRKNYLHFSQHMKYPQQGTMIALSIKCFI